MKEKKLLASPAANVARLKVGNRRLRILTVDEQRRLLAACEAARYRRLQVLLELLLITGARLGEWLALEWVDVDEQGVQFLNTKNGRVRLVEVTPRMWVLLASLSRTGAFVFTSPRTGRGYQNIDKVFARALARAAIVTGDVTPHTLRHTAISRMVLAGIDDFTIMELVGHLTKAMLARYTHPVSQRKQAALESFDQVIAVAAREHKLSTHLDADGAATRELAELLKEIGGRQEARTPDLRVANAALSQLS